MRKRHKFGGCVDRTGCKADHPILAFDRFLAVAVYLSSPKGLTSRVAEFGIQRISSDRPFCVHPASATICSEKVPPTARRNTTGENLRRLRKTFIDSGADNMDRSARLASATEDVTLDTVCVSPACGERTACRAVVFDEGGTRGVITFRNCAGE